MDLKNFHDYIYQPISSIFLRKESKSSSLSIFLYYISNFFVCFLFICRKKKKTEYENSFDKISNGTKQNMTIQVFMIEKNHNYFLIEDRKIAKQKNNKTKLRYFNTIIIIIKILLIAL